MPNTICMHIDTSESSLEMKVLRQYTNNTTTNQTLGH